MQPVRQPSPFNCPATRLHANRRSRHGFSLIDLTLTCLILGIIAATAGPRFSNAMLYYQLDGAARQIEADINYIRSYSRFANQACGLTFSATQPMYATTGVPHTNNSGSVYAVDLAALGYPVTVQANLDGGRSVTFSPNGNPQVGSPLVGLTSGTITITGGTHTRTVIIDPVTGKARRS